MKTYIKITGFIVLVLLISGLVYSLFDANKKIHNSYHTNKHLSDLKLLNKDLNIILTSSNIQNFDKIEKVSKDIDYVLLSALYHVRESNILDDVKHLSNLFKQKKDLINDFKSTDAIVNNSYKNILKLSRLVIEKVIKKSEDKIVYGFVERLVKFNIKQDVFQKSSIKELKELYLNSYKQSTVMKLFIANIEVFDEYYKKLNIINKQNLDIEFEKNIDNIINSYETYNHGVVKKMEIVIVIFVILLIMFLIFLFVLSSKLDIKIEDIKHVNDEVGLKTKKLKESLDIISKNVIYSKSDLNGVIIEVSEAFCNISGYTIDELIAKPHSLIRHKDTPSSVFKNMWKTIKSGKVWDGEVKNLKKDGSSYWVKVNVSPQFDKDGNIVSFVAVREDITLKKEIEEYNKNLGEKIENEVLKNRQKDKLLQEQSRLAQMGEMISMIAHQWRQPLSAISSTSMNIQVKMMTDQYDLSVEDDREKLKKFLDTKLKKIDDLVQVLSTTIDDFRNFFKPEKEKEVVSLTYPIDRATSIVKSVMNTQAIHLVTDYKTEDEILMHQNEIMQVVLNIFKNSEDNFAEKNSDHREIRISTRKENDTYIIQISDNGGGIPEEILPNIFDPYFSTKSEKNGTGLGLYMSKVMVEEHNDGKLIAFNTDVGVCFEIRF